MVLESKQVPHRAGDLDRAITALRDAVSLFDRTYGPDTVESGGARLQLAQALRDQDQFEAAEAEAVRRSASAPRSSASRRAFATGERAVAMGRATMPADDATLLTMIELLADSYKEADRNERALALYDEILAAAERAELVNPNVAVWRNNRGELERDVGRCREAVADFKKGAEIAERFEGDTSGSIRQSLIGQGLCLHDLGRDAEAIGALEQGLRFKIPPYSAQYAEIARGLLGQLLVDTGRDPRRGLALVREALARLHAAGTKGPTTAKLDAWLARRR